MLSARNTEHLDHASVARIFSGAGETRPQRLNLGSLIVQTSGALERVLGKDVSLEISCEQDLPPVLGVGAMIEAAVIDLCSALHVTRVSLSVSVKNVDRSRARRFLESQCGEFACISIRSNGAPAVDENRDSTKRLEKVYGIAQQHCGWLEVCGGASYDLYLPLAANRPTPAANFIDRGLEVEGGHETILLVDDELDLLSLTRDILEHYGYRIITAGNGVAALKTWREHHQEIDLLLTDMRMPEGLTGHELAERLTSEKPNLKVVYFSGYSLDNAAAARLSDGLNFLTKPFTPPGLAQVVRRALDSEHAVAA